MTSVIARIMIAPVLISSLLVASDKPTTVLAKHLYANSQNHTVLHDKQGFSVNGQRVSDADLSKDLRGVSGKALKRFFEKDKALHVSRIGNDYRIDSRDRLRAGGPGFGAFLYWATKTICYGAMGGALAAGTVAAGTVAAPIIGANAALAGGAVLGNAAAGLLPAAAGANAALAVGGIVAGNTALAGGAMVATTTMVTTTGSVAGTIAAVEAFALFMGGLGGLAPTA